jgi:hypothetical protein
VNQKFVLIAALAIISPGLARADLVNLGVLSLDNFIPAPLSPGVNASNINNLTGDRATAGFALPPDFPRLRAVTFKHSTLRHMGSVTEVVSLIALVSGLISTSTRPRGILVTNGSRVSDHIPHRTGNERLPHIECERCAGKKNLCVWPLRVGISWGVPREP